MASVQVSEDHCWINYDPNGGREGTVEVTTDNASRRGQAVSADAWDGWLYSGGHAVLCTPKVPSPLTLMLPGSVPTSSFDAALQHWKEHSTFGSAQPLHEKAFTVIK